MIKYGRDSVTTGMQTYEEWRMALPNLCDSNWKVGQHGNIIEGKYEPFDTKHIEVVFTYKNKRYKASWWIYLNGNPNKARIDLWSLGNQRNRSIEDISKVPVIEDLRAYFNSDVAQSELIRQTIALDEKAIESLYHDIAIMEENIRTNLARLTV